MLKNSLNISCSLLCGAGLYPKKPCTQSDGCVCAFSCVLESLHVHVCLFILLCVLSQYVHLVWAFVAFLLFMPICLYPFYVRRLLCVLTLSCTSECLYFSGLLCV